MELLTFIPLFPSVTTPEAMPALGLAGAVPPIVDVLGAHLVQPHALGWEAPLPPAREESGREDEGRAGGGTVEVEATRGAQRAQPQVEGWETGVRRELRGRVEAGVERETARRVGRRRESILKEERALGVCSRMWRVRRVRKAEGE